MHVRQAGSSICIYDRYFIPAHRETSESEDEQAGTRKVGDVRSADVIEVKITEPKLEIRLFLMMGLAGA